MCVHYAPRLCTICVCVCVMICVCVCVVTCMEANHIIFVEVVEGELFQALDMCRGEVQQRQHLNATLNQDKKKEMQRVQQEIPVQ